MSEQLLLLPALLTGHLQLALSALLVGVSVSVPLGILVSRRRGLEGPILGAVGVVQTIPGLALLAGMVPLLAMAGLSSIGVLPAFLGLLLYSLLPILRNTVTGLTTVDPACIEAARGVGMTNAQRLIRVELPLAMPVIIAGIRTATVWTVGTATLSTPVGAPSLGNYIFSGLQTRNDAAVLIGCVACALLALLLDALVRALEVGWTHGRRTLLALSIAGFALLYALAGVTFVRDLRPARAHDVTIGTKTFTEQYVLGEILAQLIRRTTGREVRFVPSLGSTVAFDALRAGEIDLYVEYSGTVWSTLMKQVGRPPERAELARQVEAFLRREHGIRVVGGLGFENAYALAMRRERATALGVQRISDLAPLSPQLSIGGDYEFFERSEWRAIRELYGLEFSSRRSMDPSLMYTALAQGEVDVISAFSSDGRIAALDLVLLDDDRGAIPPYDALMLANPQLADRAPDVLAALARLIDRIDGETMRRLNRAVEEEGQSPAQVARGYWARSDRSD